MSQKLIESGGSEQVHDGGISIWFFVGISLLVDGALIFGAGVWELFHPPAAPVVLFAYHANVWWGAALFVLGIVYSLRFRPTRLHL